MIHNDPSPASLASLFAQLGLADDEASIATFVRTHAADYSGGPLWEAPFWSKSQAAFLQEAWEVDAEWAEWVDELAALLHAYRA